MYTNNLDDAFSAFASGATEEWVKSDKYMDYPEYHDEEYTYIEGRTIGDITAQVSVQGEAYSQYISFMIDRYYDGIDLIGMSIWIHYELKDGSGSEDSPVNVMYNESTIRFGWVIPEKATQQSGDIKIGVWVNGTAPNTKAYILKTEEKIYTIHPGLIPGSGITQPDQTWFENFVAQMDNKVSTAQGHADDAQASKAAAAGSAAAAAQSAAASAKALEDNRAYVESQKETFVGYNRRETDLRYANALIGSVSGAGRVSVGDAWEAPIPNLDVAGRSGQLTTTGAQLLDLGIAAGTSAGGAIVSVDGGGYTISGTGTLTSSVEKRYRTDIKKLLKPGILTLKSTISTPRLYIAIRNTSTQLMSLYGNNSGQITQEMLDDENIYVEVMFFGSKDTVITPGTYHPMLYQDGDGTWEPYTGGKPSPSPEYPQPIKGTGTVSTGANLLPYPYNDKKKVMNGITFTDNGNGSVTINGTSTGVADFNFTASSKVPLSKGTLKSLYSSPEKAEEVWCQYDIYDGGGTYLGTVQGGQTIQSDDMMYLGLARIRVKSGITVTNATIRPMLCLDSHHGTWEPYTGGKPSPSAEYPQPLDVTVTGAQLLDLTHAQGGTNGGITIVVNKDGTYACSGTATNSDINVWLIGKYMEEAPTQFILKSGTYYKSGIRLFNGRKIIGPIFDGEFTLAEDTPVTGVRALQLESGKTYSNYTVYPMINAGSTALPWQPYQSRTAAITLTEPLHGIGDYRDEITMTKRINRCVEMTFDGSELWSAYTANTGFFLNNALPIIMSQRNGYCNQLIVTNKRDIPNSVWIGASNKGLYINNSDFYNDADKPKSVANWKAHLATHPLKVVTYLDTPVETDLDADTQSALNALTAYTGTTHVTIAAGGPEPDVGLEYVMDTNIVIAELKKLIEGMQNAKS